MATKEDLALSHRYDDQVVLVAALRDGDESAFRWMLARFTAPMLRIAESYAPSRAVAEEMVQETWISVVRGIDRFEGRSSLKTWIFRILMNRARSIAPKERRAIPIASLHPDDELVDEDRFFPWDHAEEPGWWAFHPPEWAGSPEERALASEVRSVVEQAVSGLPPMQAKVITMRDIAGMASDEVCNVLGISQVHQRVLLHRARTQVRDSLERYLTSVALS